MSAKKEQHPWMFANYDKLIVGSMQALARGEADEHAQKRCLKWIIEEAAKTYDLSFRPGEPGRRDTDFAEGKRFVGHQIVKMLKLNLSTFKEE